MARVDPDADTAVFCWLLVVACAALMSAGGAVLSESLRHERAKQGIKSPTHPKDEPITAVRAAINGPTLPGHSSQLPFGHGDETELDTVGGWPSGIFSWAG